MAMSARVTLRFSPFQIDVQTKDLRRDGLPVKLPPQASRLLEFLASRLNEGDYAVRVCDNLFLNSLCN